MYRKIEENRSTWTSAHHWGGFVSAITEKTATMGLDDLRGRILDLDSHMQFAWGDLARFFGDLAGRIGQARASRGLGPLLEAMSTEASWSRQERADAENVWTVKGAEAVGASDPKERLEVLDLMGIDRQLIFPMVLVAIAAWQDTDEGYQAMRRYNDFVLEWSRTDPRRLRPTTVLNMADPELTVAEAERVVTGGSRAVLLPCNRPPAGRSPADPSWDRLWSVLAEAGVPVLFHIGGHHGFTKPGWTAPSLAADALPGNPGEAAGPFELSIAHLSTEVYLAAMVLGGVFERHPRLVAGAIELGGHWIGPLAEVLDHRVALFRGRMSKLLSLKPSEYIARQVRVTPFVTEAVDLFIERHGLVDVYAFSTDFPHPEGGTRPIPVLFDKLQRLGDAVVEKVFVTNAELVLPA
jgi:predicted TIM-barrel fold metal-dependent hydrolase